MAAAPKSNIIPFQTQPAPSYPMDAVAILAHLAWQADDCPVGRFLHYLHEAELQLRSTYHLMMSELADPLRLGDRLSVVAG